MDGKAIINGFLIKSGYTVTDGRTPVERSVRVLAESNVLAIYCECWRALRSTPLVVLTSSVYQIRSELK